MKLIYPAIFTPCLESKGFSVVVPDLPGCVTEGSDLINAIEMAVDAASGWVLDELEEGHPVPTCSNANDIHAPEGSFVSMIVCNMSEYSEKYGSKTVRKNITIPAWLNSFGEKNHLNFSRILQDALLEKIGTK